MEVLEKLYICADNYLTDKNYKWDEFCTNFCDIFQAEMVLYWITFDENKNPAEFNVITTSMLAAAKEYNERKLYALHPVKESNLSPLEPILRTDIITDDEYRQMDVFNDFGKRYNYFYQLIAPAILADGSFLGLAVWRGEDKADFCAADKQRIALFMRHLLAKVQFRKLVNMRQSSYVDDFGQEYDLTKTEIEILSALLDGHSLRSIATNTERTYGTVRWHVQNILSKCNVSSQKTLMKEFYQLIKA